MAAPRTLLLTRPRAQSQAFAAALEARLPGRFRPVIAPLIEIAPVPGALDLAGLQGLIFTSANGVEQFAARTADRSLPAFCVGEMTAAAARGAGFAARSADGDVVAWRRWSSRRTGRGPAPSCTCAGGMRRATCRAARGGGRAGAGRRDLRPGAAAADRRRRARSSRPGRSTCWRFFSPRTARLFAEAGAGAGWDLARAVAVSLSAAADAALDRRPGARRRIARGADRATAMLDALARLG